MFPKLHTRVRFPSPAPMLNRIRRDSFVGGFAGFVHSLACNFLMRSGDVLGARAGRIGGCEAY
jgi:hypothetical protein